MPVDDLDRAILAALQADGRRPLSQVADLLDVAPPTVANRLDRLADAGIYRGCTPRLDYAKLGLDVTAVFHVRVRDGRVDEAIETLVDCEEITSVYAVTGDADVVAVGRYADAAAMDDRAGSVQASDAVATVRTSVVSSVVTEHDAPLVPGT